MSDETEKFYGFSFIVISGIIRDPLTVKTEFGLTYGESSVVVPSEKDNTDIKIRVFGSLIELCNIPTASQSTDRVFCPGRIVTINGILKSETVYISSDIIRSKNSPYADRAITGARNENYVAVQHIRFNGMYPNWKSVVV